MKHYLLSSLIGLLVPAVQGLPPSEVTPHELLTPQEHAAVYVHLVNSICEELVPLQDSVNDADSAAAVAARIETLHGKLYMALAHIRHNPDMSKEVARLLRNEPELHVRHQEAFRRFFISTLRCRQTGLIKSREFNRLPIGTTKAEVTP